MHIKLKIFILKSISKPSVIGSPFQTYILITQFSIPGSCSSQSIHIFNRTIFIYPLINWFSSFFIYPVHFHFFQHIDIITLVKSTSFSVQPQAGKDVTLTLDQTQVDRYDMAAITRKLNAWLSNQVQRRGLIYVLVPERHKDGAIHFHGFFNDVLDRVDSGTMIPPGGGKPRKPRRLPGRLTGAGWCGTSPAGPWALQRPWSWWGSTPRR